jgi:hypothetical protein
MYESMFPPHEIFDFAGTPGVFSQTSLGIPA